MDERSPLSARELAVNPDIVAVVGHLWLTDASVSQTYSGAGLAWLAMSPIDRQGTSLPPRRRYADARRRGIALRAHRAGARRL